MTKPVLYHTPMSPFASKVRIVMAEKRIDYVGVIVDFAAGGNRTLEFLELNPHGRVPTLIVDTVPIYESTAIIEFLEETYPEPPLLPKTPLERARVRMLEETIDGPFMDGVRNFYRHTVRFSEPDRVPRIAQECLQSVLWHHAWFDKELSSGNQFLFDAAFSVADVAAVCAIRFQLVAGIKIDPRHERLHAWYERMLIRPSVKSLDE